MGNVLEVIFATGLQGMGDVPDAYWTVQSNVELRPEVYNIIGSLCKRGRKGKLKAKIVNLILQLGTKIKLRAATLP